MTERKKITYYIPLPALCLFVLGLLSLGLHIGFRLSIPFADLYNRTVGAALRTVFAYATDWVPFSVSETLFLFLPALIVFVFVLTVHRARHSLRRALRCVLAVLAAAVLIYSLFVLTFAAGYNAEPLSEKLGLTVGEVSVEDLVDTALILRGRILTELSSITFRFRDASVMGYSYDEMSEKLMTAYETARERYPFIQALSSRVKPLHISEPMTYTHISGIYTMFTGEANINVHFPDYILPFTAAHELAHQRGIARENEANFVAFLVCTASDDPYIRYSGYLNMYEYVMSALYSASPETYTVVREGMDIRVYYEQLSYSRFFDKYRDTVVADVSEKVNDTYLSAQGTPGTKSYGMVVDLAVAYYKNP